MIELQTDRRSQDDRLKTCNFAANLKERETEIMKRILAVLLIVLMVFSFRAPAFAEGKKETWDKMGYTLTYPEEFSNTRGVVLPNPFPHGEGRHLFHDVQLLCVLKRRVGCLQ